MRGDRFLFMTASALALRRIFYRSKLKGLKPKLETGFIGE
jgi:hypothetical protein